MTAATSPTSPSRNLLVDTPGEPVGNPKTGLIFDGFRDGQYHLRPRITH